MQGRRVYKTRGLDSWSPLKWMRVKFPEEFDLEMCSRFNTDVSYLRVRLDRSNFVKSFLRTFRQSNMSNLDSAEGLLLSPILFTWTKWYVRKC